MTTAEQEYIKQIYLGTAGRQHIMHTRELALLVKARPASVTDMLKKLSRKGWVRYRKSYGFCLTDKGKEAALQIVRRCRLWELFLSEKLGIDWKDVHAIASDLQSMDNETLTQKLDRYLGYPVYDPHGEIIPDSSGMMPQTDRVEIYDLKLMQESKISGYRDSGNNFLLYVEKIGLLIGCEVRIISIIEYDNSVELQVNGQDTRIISKETAQKIYVTIKDRQTS